ncbi:class I SAM-dependent methyltransferase [Actinomadura madurae]|nr:class I SAM-dependent methyltransferase [Actinomadura madurae]MCQ0021278.1 class I SAM-dependent methyltransferase [Actinomadura madurae]
MTDEYWNHNTHYHDVVLRNVPRGCGEALDVGCGDGLLARRLAPRAAHVTGLDRSAEMVAKARRLSEGVRNVEFVEAACWSTTCPRSTTTSSAASRPSTTWTSPRGCPRCATRCGRAGGLVVISLAGNKGPRDWAFSAMGLPAHHALRLRNLRRSRGGPGAPIADPAMTWAEVRDEAQRVLPGAVFRRHLLWRYSLVWRKPR